MPRLHDLCSRIQNGFRARLQTIAIPETKMNLAVVNILYKEGFLSSVTRGNHIGPDLTYTPTTNENVATRRLWLNLKYKANNPALSKLSLVSKPSKKVHFTVNELKNIANGRRAQFIKPLQPGEVVIVNTNRGVLEIQEAIEKNVGGEVMCRAL
ncbi:30S ribosomal protein S8 [Cokeromyces recurvatus]|uniref:30S ribosomal protein S8 n=1 Tax=Cokeromyces recurvatus TaxID=90255 RepID=UPI00221F12C5|nr:30S ribosomal protein S8 [Cokeromyces recurvatus]KAI7903401.1 30S ribosomal protein S8 [Cokeromyces recurvatus]